MYRAYGLLKPNTEFTLDAAAPKLAAALPHLTPNRQEGLLQFANDEWEIHLKMNASPDVLDESLVIAGQISGAEDEPGIRTCAARVEVSSAVIDEGMAYFGDFLKVIDVLKSFPGVIMVEPEGPSLM
ncbi:MAG: hypothetical protein K2X38_15110 [Gemmataceae bacterium]|nr:hypothetical protein [Gemmataceae bacterium]